MCVFVYASVCVQFINSAFSTSSSRAEEPVGRRSNIPSTCLSMHPLDELTSSVYYVILRNNINRE